MAIAAVAHVYVFSAQPYQLLPVSEYGKVTTQEKLTLVEKGNKEGPTILEKTGTEIEAPGTSVKESIQDIVVEGGQHVSSPPRKKFMHEISSKVSTNCFLIFKFLIRNRCVQIRKDMAKIRFGPVGLKQTSGKFSLRIF